MALKPSSVRTLKVLAASPQKPLDWPIANSDEDLDYSLDVSEQLADIGDTLVSVSISIAPNGPLELQSHSPSVDQDQGLITVDLAGGLGRKYKVKVVGTTATGEVFSWLVGLQVQTVQPVLSVWPLPPPKGYGYGTPVVWNASGQSGLTLTLARPLTVSVAAVLF